MSEMMPSGMGLPFARRRGAGQSEGCGGTGATMAVAPWMAMTRTSSPGPTVLAALGQARGPGLAGELDPAVGVGHGLQDAGLPTDERGGADLVVDLAVHELPPDHRAHDEQQEQRDGDRDDDLERERVRRARRPRHRRQRRRRT